MSTRRRTLFWILSVLALIVVVFVLWPSPIDPVAIEPIGSLPFEGALAANELLRSTELLARGKVKGPEDVDVDDQGRVYGACLDGRIVRIDGDRVETFADTGGRPLGMDFDREGRLIVCDAIKGLLSVSKEGEVSTLCTESEGVKFGFADDVEIAGDGTIYFSDASSKFGVGSYMEDLLEGRPHGRLLSFDPESGKTRTLLDGLYFANGVAVAADDSFVLVNETYRYRITRYWLKGERAGTHEILIDQLPGFPDGISSSPRGTFWVAMFTVRNPTADSLAGYPWIRSQMAKLPRGLWPKPVPYGLVLELDSEGKVLRSLHDPGGQKVSVITSVHEENGDLYFGTLIHDWIGRWKLPATSLER